MECFFNNLFTGNFIQRFRYIFTLQTPWSFLKKTYGFITFFYRSGPKMIFARTSLSVLTIDVKLFVSDSSSPLVTNIWFNVLWTFGKTTTFSINFSIPQFWSNCSNSIEFSNIKFYFGSSIVFANKEQSTLSSTKISLITFSSEFVSIIPSSHSSYFIFSHNNFYFSFELFWVWCLSSSVNTLFIISYICLYFKNFSTFSRQTL